MTIDNIAYSGGNYKTLGRHYSGDAGGFSHFGKEGGRKNMVVEVERQTINVSAAGKILGLSRATAYSLANKGQLPGCFRCGRRLLVSARVIEKLLEGERINSADQPDES